MNEANGMSEEIEKENVRMNEKETLEALFALGNYRDDAASRKLVELKRGGKTVLSFRVRPLSEEENDSCLKNNSVHKKDKRTGVVTRIKTDKSRYRSELIYTATVDEDKYIWENRKAWEQYAVASAPDLISAVLQQGEKDRIIAVISEISGYGDEDADEEETAKN